MRRRAKTRDVVVPRMAGLGCRRRWAWRWGGVGGCVMPMRALRVLQRLRVQPPAARRVVSSLQPAICELRRATGDGRRATGDGRRATGDRRTGGQADRRTGGQADRRTGGQADRRTGGQADRRTGGQADRRTGGQADRRTGGQADRRTSGQADKRTSGQATVRPTPSTRQSRSDNVPRREAWRPGPRHHLHRENHRTANLAPRRTARFYNRRHQPPPSPTPG